MQRNGPSRVTLLDQCWNNEATAAVVTKKGEPLGRKDHEAFRPAMGGLFEISPSIRRGLKGIGVDRALATGCSVKQFGCSLLSQLNHPGTRELFNRL